MNCLISAENVFRITKQRRLNNVDWPGWMHYAWQEQTIVPFCNHIELPDKAEGIDSINYKLVLFTAEGRRTINWGDVLIYNEVRGDITLIRKESLIDGEGAVDLGCANCFYYSGAHTSECRRHPPKRTKYGGKFPSISQAATYWCGEFKEAEK